MALVIYPECGNQISEKANNCPNCGKPSVVQEFKWELIISIAVVGPLIAFFVGYGNYCNDPVVNLFWT